MAAAAVPLWAGSGGAVQAGSCRCLSTHPSVRPPHAPACKFAEGQLQADFPQHPARCVRQRQLGLWRRLAGVSSSAQGAVAPQLSCRPCAFLCLVCTADACSRPEPVAGATECLNVVPHTPAAIPYCSIVGKRADSRTVQNKLTDVVANANRGDYRVRVGAVATSPLWPSAARSMQCRHPETTTDLLRSIQQSMSLGMFNCRCPAPAAFRWASGCACTSPPPTTPAGGACSARPAAARQHWAVSCGSMGPCPPAKSVCWAVLQRPPQPLLLQTGPLSSGLRPMARQCRSGTATLPCRRHWKQR